MNKMKFLATILTSLFCLILINQKAQSSKKINPGSKQTFKLEEISDASCVIALDKDVIAVGEDETNKIKIYNPSVSIKPLYSYSLKTIWPQFPEKEIDLEAVTKIDNLTYWMGSHSRNSKGELKKKRHYLFALKFSGKEKKYKPELVGRPFTNFVTGLVSDERLKKLDLEDLSEKNNKKRAAKTNTGFNIEGLTYWLDPVSQQKKLLVGLRSPVFKKKAIIIPIENPYGITYGDAPLYGAPIFWNLGSRGIRSIEYDPTRNLHLIIAGSCDTSKNFSLYSWSGKLKDKPKQVKNLNLDDLNVEGLTIFSDNSILLVSDDGGMLVNGKKQKDLAKAGKKVYFRATRFSKLDIPGK